jgi:hypothetical protein
MMLQKMSPPQSQSGVTGRVGHRSQDSDAHQQQTDPLLIQQISRLHEAYPWHMREADDSNMCTIPSQHRVTMQILEH